MSSIVIAGDTSGSVTLQAPAVAGSTVLNLPATSGTIQTSGAGYTANGVAYASSTSALTTGSALTFDGTNFASTGNITSGGVLQALTTVQSSSGADLSLNANGANRDVITKVNGTELTRLVGSTGNLGIGTSSPYAKIQTFQSSSTLPVNWIYRGNQTLDNNLPTTYGFPYLHIGRSEYRVSSLQTIGFGYVSANGGNPPAEIGYLCATVSGETYGDLVFATRSVTTNTAASERARIDSSGNLLVGTATNNGRLCVQGATANSSANALYVTSSSGSQMFLVRNDGALRSESTYYITTASAGNLNIDTSGYIARSTSSLKYKNNVQDATHGLAKVLALRPVTYKGNNNGDTVFGGLIAEEVHEAGLTEFVQYAEDGSPDALAYGNMVSLAFKAIQEQQALITTLTDRITALEGV